MPSINDTISKYINFNTFLLQKTSPDYGKYTNKFRRYTNIVAMSSKLSSVKTFFASYKIFDYSCLSKILLDAIDLNKYDI